MADKSKIEWTDADHLSAALDEIRQRWEVFGEADAVPRLLAALEAVLELADEAVPVDRDYGGEPIWWNLTPAGLREAISRALLGKEGGRP